jgi:hypothetical protein
MGRPINKKYFGVLGDVTPKIPVEAATFANKTVTAEGGTTDIFIVKQKSARKFLVQHTEDGSQYVCRLVDKLTAPDDSTQLAIQNSGTASAAYGQMVIIGHYNGQSKTIRSLTNKLATDFNSVRYKWTLSDDSTTSLLTLTAIV